jgi:hypothetical protein
LNTAPGRKENHVIVTTKPALMIAFAAACVAATGAPSLAQGGSGDAVTTELDGRCDYRRAAAKVGSGTGFAPCNSVVITRSGSNSVIDYRRSLGGSEFRYAGTLSGNTMTIARLTIQNREPMAASGECTIFHKGQQISTVTCAPRPVGRPLPPTS